MDALTTRLLKRLQQQGATRYKVEFLAARQSICSLREVGYSGKAIHRALAAEGTVTCSYRTFRRYMTADVETHEQRVSDTVA